MTIHGRRRLLALTSLLVLLLLSAFAARACVWRPASTFSGEHFNRGTNAAWLAVEWVMQQHTEAELAALADELESLQIRYLFVYVSYLKPEGHFNPTYTYVTDFTSTLKAAQPGLHVQAWIGVPTNRRVLGISRGYVDLDDIAVRRKIVAFCAEIIEQGGFDGVHIDVEPVPNGDSAMIALLEEVRDSLGPSKSISIAARQIFPGTPLPMPPLAGGFWWSRAYYQETARRADQIAVMTYDSGLPLATLYRQWMRFQAIGITAALDGTDTMLFFGVPTSEERTVSHWPGSENMTSGLQGLIAGLNDEAARPAAASGVAIYPHWETDSREWADYRALWLGQ
jgi:hypothetical protein